MVESLSRPWFRAEGIDPKNAPKEAAALSTLHSSNTLTDAAVQPVASVSGSSSGIDEAEERVWATVDTKCGRLLEQLRVVTDEDERRSLHVALNMCVASVVCPDAANKFQRILEEAAAAAEVTDPTAASATVTDDKEEQAFSAMSACVVQRAGMRRERQQKLKAASSSVTNTKGDAAASLSGTVMQ
jgi:hypothetical protein